jgi:hypothetical protein
MVTLVRPYKKAEANCSSFPSLDSVHDIGKKVDRILVSALHYTAYERSIVSAASSLLTSANHQVKMQRTEHIKTALSDNRKLEAKYKLDAVLLKKMPLEAQHLSLLEISDVLRLTARECMWAELYAGKKIVEFGWDGYVYFAGGQLRQIYLDEFTRIGRVVEKVKRSRSGSAIS